MTKWESNLGILHFWGWSSCSAFVSPTSLCNWCTSCSRLSNLLFIVLCSPCTHQQLVFIFASLFFSIPSVSLVHLFPRYVKLVTFHKTFFWQNLWLLFVLRPISFRCLNMSVKLVCCWSPSCLLYHNFQMLFLPHPSCSHAWHFLHHC